MKRIKKKHHSREKLSLNDVISIINFLFGLIAVLPVIYPYVKIIF